MNSPLLSPTEKQIDIWLLDNAHPYSEAEIGQLKLLLTPEELERQQRFAFAKDRNQYILARALLRTTLSLYEPKIKPEQWRFDFNAWGKPSIVLELQSSIHFNLSHTHNFVALAIRQLEPVGIDVECLQRGNDLPSLAKHCFTEKEQSYVTAGDVTALPRRFFNIWTLKEALIKAHGQGLSLGLKHFDFELKPSGIKLGSDKDLGANYWYFNCWSMNSDHTLAVAAPCKTTEQSMLNVKFYSSRPRKGFIATETPPEQISLENIISPGDDHTDH